MIRRKTNRRHMIGDHHGWMAARATLLVRAVDGILGTHRSCTSRGRGRLMHLPRVLVIAGATALLLGIGGAATVGTWPCPRCCSREHQRGWCSLD